MLNLTLVSIGGITAQTTCNISDLTVTKTDVLCSNDGKVTIKNNGTCFNTTWKAVLKGTSSGGIAVNKEQSFNAQTIELTQLPASNSTGYTLTFTNGTTTLTWTSKIMINTSYVPMVITPSATASTCSNGTDGTFTFRITSGGTGPFVYSINSPSGGVKTYGPTNDRSYTFTSGVRSGETITYSVTDYVNNIASCSQTQNSTLVAPTATSPSIKFRQVVLMPTCQAATCDKYKPMVQVLFGPEISTNTQSPSAKKQMDYTDIPGNITITLNGTTYNMVRSATDPFGSAVPADQTDQYYVPVDANATISKGQAFTVKTKQYCTGAETTITRTLKPVQSIMKLSADASPTGIACDQNRNIKFSLYRDKYSLGNYDNDNEDPYTYHLSCAKGVLDKKNSDGTWTTLKSEVDFTGPTRTNSYQFYTETSMGGTYRVTYDDGCDKFTSESTPNISPPTLSLAAGLSAFGNTTAFNIIASNFSASKSYTITTVPAVSSITFDAADPYSNTLTSRTVNFPIKFDAGSTLYITDLPPGYRYKVTVRDNECGIERSTEIAPTRITSFTPKTTDGFKNGIRVNVGCGDTGSSMDYDFGTTNIIGLTSVALIRDDDTNAIPLNYLTIPPSSSATSRSGSAWNSTRTAQNLSPGAYTLVFYRFVSDPSPNRTYSAIRGEFVSTTQNPKTNPQRVTFPVVVPPYKPIEIQNTVTYDKSTQTGTLTSTIINGTPIYPIKCDLLKEDGTVFDSHIETDHSVASHVFTGLPLGKYTIRASNGWNAANSTFCDQVVAKISINVKNFWVGNKDNNWNDPENWASKTVPGIGEDVEFATIINNQNEPAQRDTHLPKGKEITIGSLTNNTDFATVVPAGGSLTISGNVIGSDTQDKAHKIKIQAAKDATSHNGTFIVTNGCTLPPIYGTVQLYAKGKYDETFPNWVDNIYDSPTQGTLYTAKWQWQHFGIPVAEVVASPIFDGSSIRKYSEKKNLSNQFFGKWDDLNNSSVLRAFEGYEITQRNPATYTITGRLMFCDKTLELTRIADKVNYGTSGVVPGVNERYGLGQNIFGNSFTSAIKISEMTIPETVEQTVYLYNTGTFGQWGGASLIPKPVDNATAMSAGSYISIPKEAGNVIWDDQIPSLQGFLLKYTTAETVYNDNAAQNAKVTLKYANGGVTTNTRPQLAPKSQSTTTPSVLRVNLQSKTTVDNLWLIEKEGASEKFDNGWDGRKYFGTPTAFIYAQTLDGPMQVNTDKTIDGSVVSFYANDDTEYTLTLIKSHLEQYENLHLFDFKTRTLTPLSADTTVYTFTADNHKTVEKRFLIVNSANLNINSGELQLLDGYLKNNNLLVISNFTTQSGEMKLFDASGRLIKSAPIHVSVNEIPVDLQKGVYILRMHADGKKAGQKIIIR